MAAQEIWCRCLPGSAVRLDGLEFPNQVTVLVATIPAFQAKPFEPTGRVRRLILKFSASDWSNSKALKVALESVHLAQQLRAGEINMGLAGNYIDVGWILKGGWMGECWGTCIEESVVLEHSPHFIHYFDERKSGGVSGDGGARDMLQEIVCRYRIKRVIIKRDWLTKQVCSQNLRADRIKIRPYINAEQLRRAVRIARNRSAAEVEMTLIHRSALFELLPIGYLRPALSAACSSSRSQRHWPGASAASRLALPKVLRCSVSTRLPTAASMRLTWW